MEMVENVSACDLPNGKSLDAYGEKVQNRQALTQIGRKKALKCLSTDRNMISCEHFKLVYKMHKKE